MIGALFGLMFSVVTDVHVIDGDTFAVGGERIRILSMDTPELRGKCVGEVILEKRAKYRLRQLLRGPVIISRHGRDRYGRTLAHVYASGADVAEVMIGEGLARRWTGRREPWCR